MELNTDALWWDNLFSRLSPTFRLHWWYLIDNALDEEQARIDAGCLDSGLLESRA